MTTNDLSILLLIIIGWWLGASISKKLLYPKLIKKGTKIVEINPKWITPHLRQEYYGFQDIDIILAESTNIFSVVPRMEKNNDRYELLIPEETSVRDVDIIAKLALAGKIRMQCGLDFSNKPIYWLSIFCYMLDGGDIKQEATSWEERPLRKTDENGKNS